jgi:hypothetical protein
VTLDDQAALVYLQGKEKANNSLFPNDIITVVRETIRPRELCCTFPKCMRIAAIVPKAPNVISPVIDG